MNERQLTRLEVEAEHAEDRKTLILLREIRKLRRALRQYAKAHADASNHINKIAEHPDAGDRLWRGYYGAWKALGENPIDVDQLI